MAARPVEFDTQVRPTGRAATLLPVPLDIRAHFGRTRPPVRVTVNGHTYRSTPALLGDRFVLPLRGDAREAAGIAPGDVVHVLLEEDTVPREGPVPPALHVALARDPAAARSWAALAPARRRAHAAWVAAGHRPEIRARRVGRVLADLATDATRAPDPHPARSNDR